LGVNLVLIDRGIDPIAEELFADNGVMCVQRVSHKELIKVSAHTGGRMLKRTGLKKPSEEIQNYLGFAAEVFYDNKLKNLRIMGGKGKPAATILVGASTDEVAGERERIAKDAASAVQAAVTGGVVPGGGAIELAAAKAVEQAKVDVRGMAAYGVECVAEALKKPFMQIVTNAGFNPLEKMGDVLAAQAEKNIVSYAVDCDTGEIKDMFALGIIDPAPVKIHALKAAGEVAQAILRIDKIIKKKERNTNMPQIFNDV
jgi:chaperonin GroEL (HSP60 family)